MDDAPYGPPVTAVPASGTGADDEPALDRGTAGPFARRVLVVGTDQWAIEQAAAQLRAAGRRVLGCHDPGEPSFPCNALVPGRACPVDEGIDLAVDVRARPVNPPTLDEFGAVCALHAQVPLMVAGVPGDSGFGPWATSAVANGVDLIAACDEAAARNSA